MGVEVADAARVYNRGVAHARAGNFERAIECWKQALKDDPDMAEAEFNQALAYERLQDVAAARKHYTKFLQMTEDPEEIQSVEEHLAQLSA